MTSQKLIILETDENKKLGVQSLIKEGYQTHIVNKIDVAIKATKEQSYDLFILRHEEPELLNMLMANFPPQLGTLVICPKNTLQKMMECSGPGIYSFIEEPITPKKLKYAVAKSINKTRTIEEAIRNKFLTSFEKANHLLSAETDIDRFYKLVAEESISSTSSDSVTVIIKNELNGIYEIKASLGHVSPACEKACRLAMIRNEPVIMSTTEEDKDKDDMHLSKQMAAAGLSAIICLPLIIKGETVGAINHLKLAGHGGYSKNDVSSASILGWWTGIALENIRLLKRVEKQADHVEILLSEVLSAQQNERQRVAIEIHDGVAQWMVGASFGIKACSTLISESRLSELEIELNKIRETMQKSVKELRRAISNLRPIPLQEIGLVPAICQIIESLNQEGMKCSVETDEQLPVMSLAEETAIYWIVQESISNIRKHSNATEVVVKIHTYDGGIKIEICDNGIGFKTDVILNSSLMLEHMGLVGMQERAKLIGGSMNVDSTPGAGTSVILSIPVLSKQLTEIIL